MSLGKITKFPNFTKLLKFPILRHLIMICELLARVKCKGYGVGVAVGICGDLCALEHKSAEFAGVKEAKQRRVYLCKHLGVTS